MGHHATGSTCHTEIQCRAAGVKHPSHGAGVVMSNEASNHKATPFPQLSWRDEIIMLKKEVGGTKQPSFHSLLKALLPQLHQVFLIRSTSSLPRDSSAVVLPHVGCGSAW